jgi:hypothetical protein
MRKLKILNMKQNLLKFTFLLFGAAIFLTSCDPDLIDPIDEGDPTISVTGTPQGTIDAGSTFTITVNATPASTNPLKTIDITEDNQIIDFSRLTIEGNGATANPILLFGSDKDGLSWQIDIVAHGDASTREYSVNVADDNNNQSSFSFDVTTGVMGPTLIVNSSMDIEVAPSSLIGIMTEFVKGTFDLATFAVYQNDELVSDLDRLYYGELSVNFEANPLPIPTLDNQGAEPTIYLRIRGLATNDTYRFVLADTDGNSSSFEFNVLTTTPVKEITGVLLNAAGPVGTGGLDLDTGDGTGSADAAAEIRDEGIDLDQPLASNWRKSISGVNGSVMKQLKPGENGLSEDFSYDDVTSVETITASFENGEAFTLMNDDGDLISASVNVGDTFVVQNGTKYYLIIIREISETADNNADFYTIDIKQ